ncbi:MFS transporter [Thermomicrobium sp. CFH 73360]|uniref:MFS transporter n=1 Tax=Thermomicrobium sp. CFH 73360 TaxID=2951987 RepID=UPI002076DD49|nr:MFS transporter [Thermomicrobium sp. CFH 73360]MCM8745943.1 MFS transporter [Thermomicrobium sp. CFH 73360]
MAGEPAAVARAQAAEKRTFWDAGGVALMSWAHFAHDLYPSFLGVLVPAIQAKLGVSLFWASAMVPAQQLPSIIQPFLGYVADRTSRRWFVVLTPGVAALALSSVGIAPHFSLVLLLLLVSGLASAAFHAPAVALVGEFGGQRLGRAMAIFMAGGELARTVAPLILTAVIAHFTLDGMPIVMVVGLAASLTLYLRLRTEASDAIARRYAGSVRLRALLRDRRRPFIGLLGSVVANTAAVTPPSFFLVEYLLQRGRSEWYGGLALSAFYASGIIGGLVGGSLSDWVGRRGALLLSSLGTAPLLALYLAIEDGSWLMLPLLVIIGVFATPPRSVTLALANDIAPEARGPLSGFTLATSFVAQSVLALAFGAVADAIGIERAFWLTVGASLAGVPFALLVPAHIGRTRPVSG